MLLPNRLLDVPDGDLFDCRAKKTITKTSFSSVHQDNRNTTTLHFPSCVNQRVWSRDVDPFGKRPHAGSEMLSTPGLAVKHLLVDFFACAHVYLQLQSGRQYVTSRMLCCEITNARSLTAPVKQAPVTVPVGALQESRFIPRTGVVHLQEQAHELVGTQSNLQIPTAFHHRNALTIWQKRLPMSQSIPKLRKRVSTCSHLHNLNRPKTVFTVHQSIHGHL